MCHRNKVLSELNGSINSKVLFVAEAPGRLGADRTRIPLNGDKTGDNFESLLGNIGWKREAVFITNAILCNPRNEEGNNVTPKKAEIFNCSKYLEMTINLVRPEVVVSLGRVALNALDLIAPNYCNLQENVATPVNWNGIVLFPLYHPGPRALIHRSIIKQRADFMKLAKFINPYKGIVNRINKFNKNISYEVNNQTVTPLQQIVFLIVRNFKQISNYKLTKLLYLIDLTSLYKLGYTLTGEIFLRQQEGPWPPSIKEAIKSLENFEVHSFFRNRLPILKLGSSPRFEIELEENAINIILEVINNYGTMNNSQIKTKTYLTPPMKYILRQEKLGRDMRRIPILYKDKTVIDHDSKTKK